MADFVQQDNNKITTEPVRWWTVMPSLTCLGVLMRQRVDVYTISWPNIKTLLSSSSLKQRVVSLTSSWWSHCETNQQRKLYKLSEITCLPNFNEMSSTDKGWMQISVLRFTSVFNICAAWKRIFILAASVSLTSSGGQQKYSSASKFEKIAAALIIPCTEMLLE